MTLSFRKCLGVGASLAASNWKHFCPPSCHFISPSRPGRAEECQPRLQGTPGAPCPRCWQCLRIGHATLRHEVQNGASLPNSKTVSRVICWEIVLSHHHPIIACVPSSSPSCHGKGWCPRVFGSSNAFFLVLDDVIGFVEDDQNILDIFITDKGTRLWSLPQNNSPRFWVGLSNDPKMTRPGQCRLLGTGGFYCICQRSVKRSSMSYLTIQGKLRLETTFSASPLVWISTGSSFWRDRYTLSNQ